jgi:hypothetical protein
LQNYLKRAAGWIGRALAAEVTKPIKEQFAEQNKKIDSIIDAQCRLEERVTMLHKTDAVALECDLSVMDDRICYLISVCRHRGYTTAEERRRITRMHEAYQARGGNHGEENEYALFLRLPTEEEYERTKGDYHEEH